MTRKEKGFSLKVTEVKDLTIDDVYGLMEFKQKLKGHLENPPARIPHQEVVDSVG